MPAVSFAAAGLVSSFAADQPAVTSFNPDSRSGALLPLHVLYCVYLD
jgi:hypothetical protein